MDYWRFELTVEHGNVPYLLVGEAYGEARADVIETAMRRFGLQRYETEAMTVVEEREVHTGECVPWAFQWEYDVVPGVGTPVVEIWRLDEDVDLETAVTPLPEHVLMERVGAPRLF